MFDQALHLQCKDLRLILKLPTSTRQVAVKYLKHCNQTYPSQLTYLSSTRHSRGHWLRNVRKPANFKGDIKAAAIYVGRATTLHNLLFYVDTSG